MGEGRWPQSVRGVMLMLSCVAYYTPAVARRGVEGRKEEEGRVPMLSLFHHPSSHVQPFE